MSDPIVFEKLTKLYGGGFKAVDSLDLDVKSNTFMGFLGPNGAGKTTAIKMLTGLLTITSGNAYLNGVDVKKSPKVAMESVGAVVETPEFYPFLTPRETLEYLGRLRGMSIADINQRSKAVLETVRMTEWSDIRIGKFSKGMKQRIAIAQALLHEPQVIVLDEPTSGLDPRGMVEVREILKDLKKQNYTVFMSSHLLNEVQEICSNVALINHGKLLANGTVEELISKVDSRRLEVRLANKVQGEAMDKLRAYPGVKGLEVVTETQFFIDFQGSDEKQAQLLIDIQGLGYKVVSFKESGLALENLYMSLIDDSR
ncbi:MAG TPA: ABC transporter ATP-binding protein [Methanomassiliicoccales archaeon]|nr:ABC transporter ATP-binding protein [Methanomassiliicoccales archaeon]